MGKRSREKELRKVESRRQQPAISDLRSPLERYAFLIIEFGVYLALLAPAIMLRDYFFPFIVPKTIYFRIVVDIMFVAYVFLAAYNPKFRPRLNPLTIAVSIFLAISILASVFGVNFQRSFWSVFERMTGLLTLIHLFVFFIILTSVFKERKYWERMLASSIIVGMIVCFLGWTSTEASTRGGSTIGNTSFMAGYLLFNIFFAIILFFTKDLWWKIFSLSAVVVLAAGLFISIEPSRGAIGALLIGIFLLGLGYLMHYLIKSGRKNLRKLGMAIPFVLVLAVLLMLQLDFIKEKIVNEWGSTSIYSRRVIWQMAIEGWKEKPWLGWGPENFNIPFVKYFDPQLPISGDIWYDRTHNIIFDTAVASGLIGLLSYLSIFGAAFWGLLRIVPKIQERKNLLFPMGMIAVLTAYFIQNLFVFDMISSYMMFFLSLSFVAFLAFPAKDESSPQESYKTGGILSSFVAALLIAVALLTIYFGNMLPAQASRYTIRGLILPIEESFGYFQKALKISPISQFEVPEQFALRSMELARQPVKDINALKEQMKQAEDTLKKSIARDPLNYRERLFLGRYYNNLYEIFGDPEKLIFSEQILKDAIQYSPKNQQNYWTLGQIRLFQTRRDEAIEFFQKAVDLEPRLGVSHWYLAMGYRIAGKYEQAAVELKEAEKFNYNFKGSVDDLKKAIDVYIGLDDKAALLPLLEKAVELDPKEPEPWARLADVYAFFGRNEEAKKAALRIIALDPERTAQIKEFLDSMGFNGELEIANFKAGSTNSAKYIVTMQNMAFNPNTIKVPVGSTVVWENKDTAPHTVKMEAVKSGTLETGQKFEYTFKEKGEFQYICSLHTYMKGRIIVE